MRGAIERVRNIKQIFFACYPLAYIKAREVKRTRIAAQSFFTGRVEKIFMKIRKGKFARSAINRFAVSQYSMICF